MTGQSASRGQGPSLLLSLFLVPKTGPYRVASHVHWREGDKKGGERKEGENERRNQQMNEQISA